MGGLVSCSVVLVIIIVLVRVHQNLGLGGWLACVHLCTFVYFRMPFGTGQVDFLTVVILNVLHVLLLRAIEGYLQSLFLFLGMRETLIVCAKLVIPLKP